MSAVKVSFNKACMITGLFYVIISASMMVMLYFLTGSSKVMFCGLLFALLGFSCMAFLIALIRCRLLLFSDSLCKTLDNMMAGEAVLPQIRQLRKMLYREGISISIKASATAIVSGLICGRLLCYLAYEVMSLKFIIFRVTVWPMLFFAVLIVGLQIIVSFCICKSIERDTLTERLRTDTL